MGLYDRDYTQQRYEYRYTGPQMRIGYPRMPSVVKWLLIINVAVFIPSFMSKALQNLLIVNFSVFPNSLFRAVQIWRFVSYQFIHDPTGFGHIFFNMITLFFFGPMLEKLWGPRKFLIFYLVCGAMGGLVYTLLVLVGWLAIPMPLIGASGAILGTLAATTVLYPKVRVYVWGIFPVPLIVLSGILAIFAVLTLFSPHRHLEGGGEAAHLAGMAAGAFYVLRQNWRTKLLFKLHTAVWKGKINAADNLQAELDRILQKVHDHGIHSLTRNEKRTLRHATKIQQMKNRI